MVNHKDRLFVATEESVFELCESEGKAPCWRIVRWTEDDVDQCYADADRMLANVEKRPLKE